MIAGQRVSLAGFRANSNQSTRSHPTSSEATYRKCEYFSAAGLGKKSYRARAALGQRLEDHNEWLITYTLAQWIPAANRVKVRSEFDVDHSGDRHEHALVNDKSEVSNLVDLYALIARMKILSSDAVIEAAEKAARLILETYPSPNRTFGDLPGLMKEMDPLRDFSEACRRELQRAHQR